MTRDAMLDRTFLEHRAKLLDLAAFLDRSDRCPPPPEAADPAEKSPEDDFRLAAMRNAIELLIDEKPQRAKRILEMLSDPSADLLAAAPDKAAGGVPASPRDAATKP